MQGLIDDYLNKRQESLKGMSKYQLMVFPSALKALFLDLDEGLDVRGCFYYFLEKVSQEDKEICNILLDVLDFIDLNYTGELFWMDELLKIVEEELSTKSNIKDTDLFFVVRDLRKAEYLTTNVYLNIEFTKVYLKRLESAEEKIGFIENILDRLADCHDPELLSKHRRDFLALQELLQEQKTLKLISENNRQEVIVKDNSPFSSDGAKLWSKLFEGVDMTEYGIQSDVAFYYRIMKKEGFITYNITRFLKWYCREYPEVEPFDRLKSMEDVQTSSRHRAYNLAKDSIKY